MEWRDSAIILSAKRHGESAVLLHVMTEAHGRHAGLVPGGASRRYRGIYQSGNQIACRWRARLATHLGTFSAEPVAARAAGLLDDPARLAAMSAACSVLDAVLLEREPHAAIYHGLVAFLDALGEPDRDMTDWGAAYVGWELGVLRELGFGLDLSACAATGATDDLCWVSPKTGRAVSAEAGAPYRDKLLRLPGFLINGEAADPATVLDGLKLTGHFLARHGLHRDDATLPAARDRLVAIFARTAPISGG